MLGRRKGAFERLYALLRQLENSPQNIEPIVEFHRTLLSEIVRAERHIARHRSGLQTQNRALRVDRPSKDEATRLRKVIARTERLIESYKQQIFIWKCFGDGLAFVYLDKYSVKHAYLETTAPAARQPSGFISGKAGLGGELLLLETAIAQGVPALLCDVTNVLRHGDICLLGGSDPFVIEVKLAGSASSARAKRQQENITRLHDFLEKDFATDFRGTAEVRRAEFTIPERNYVNELNQCIAAAYQRGHCVVSPEEGLRYVALLDSKVPITKILGEFSGREIAFSLNSAKINGEWVPYLPFTVSIREQLHLYDFIEGRLFLIVLVHMDKLCELMARPGFQPRLSLDEDYAFKLVRDDGSTGMGLSRQFIGRIGFEFLSPAWVAEAQARNFDDIEARLASANAEPTDISE